MSHSPHIFKPETRPHDCWDWVTAEDVCRHALAAFYLARESMKQPTGQRFVTDGMPWAGRENFGDNLALLFDMRIKTDGYHLGVNPDWANEAKMLQRWHQPVQAGSEHPKASTTSPSATPAALSGVWGETPCKRSEAEPALSRSHSTTNPEGLASDAVHAAKTPPDALRALKNLTPPF